MLLAREVPPRGGDTLFASMYLAYENLSEGMKRLIAPLVAVNASAKADVTRTREDRVKTDGADAKKEYVAEHPVVRTHPETGRKALYVNTAHTVRFGGMTEAESAPLLNYLFQHQVRPEYTCRFAWRVSSIALWDNRCAQHNPVNDYHGYRRVMHRITLAGDKPKELLHPVPDPVEGETRAILVGGAAPRAAYAQRADRLAIRHDGQRALRVGDARQPG